MTSIFDEAYDATITDLAERGVGRAFPAPLVQRPALPAQQDDSEGNFATDEWLDNNGINDEDGSFYD